MDLITLEPKSHKGKNRVAEAKRRLATWDGKTWRVTHRKFSVLFSDKPGPWAHVVPNVDLSNHTDWLSRWVNLNNDADFIVTANA